MNQLHRKFLPAAALGFTLFSMFFGAGNILFPIELGKHAGSALPYALIGLYLSGIVFTFIGFCAVLFRDGSHHAFFNQLGETPGFLLSTLILVVVGPLTGASRATVILHTIYTSRWAPIPLSPFIVGLLCILFVLCFKRERIVTILGFIISPIIILSLLLALGYMLTPAVLKTLVPTYSPIEGFWDGFTHGYHTMDMLAAFHFVPLALLFLNRFHYATPEETTSEKKAETRKIAVTGIFFACTLLLIIYTGLGMVGAYYGISVDTKNPALLTSLIFRNELPWALSICIEIIIMLATISTSISLTTVFSEYLHADIFQKKITYPQALILTLLLTGFAAHDGLHSILKIEKYFLLIAYPPLIVFTFLSIMKSKYQKTPLILPTLLVTIGSSCAVAYHYEVFAKILARLA